MKRGSLTARCSGLLAVATERDRQATLQSGSNMKRFSQRINAAEPPSIIQLESISDPLRNSIWNLVVSLFNEGESGWWRIAEISSQFFFKLPTDELPAYNLRRRGWLKKQFYELHWYEVYDYIEFVVEWYPKAVHHQKFRKDQLQSIFNRIFEDELSGYRFVNGELAPISSPVELATV